MHSRPALWTAFLVVHAWLAVVGVVMIPQRAFWDLDLYRYWMWQGVFTDQWPVLDTSSVYPAGAVVPMLMAGIGGLGYGAGYAIAWCVMVTALDAAALGLLLRRAQGMVGGWWWTAFLLLLGPIAMGRLDAVIVPITLVALLWALERPAVASALLTIGAWIKVAPGALLVSVLLAARRPWRDVIAPAAGVSALVVGTVVALGGGGNVASFLLEQDQRGLQIEAPGATPWLVVALFSRRVSRVLNQEISTWEVQGPGTQGMADTLGVLFFVAIVGVAALLWWRRETLGHRMWTDTVARGELLLRGAMLLTLAMLVFNKVGSPQYMTWLAAPVVAALGLGLPGWQFTARWVLVVAAATQIVFPWFYTEITYGGAGTTAILAARNALLVVLLVTTARDLVRDSAPAPLTQVADARAVRSAPREREVAAPRR